MHRHYGLLALATVLHRGHRSRDASNILVEALQDSPENPVLHFALGNVYATMLEFDRADFHFGECLRFQPTFDSARFRRHAVRCHSKLETALMKQQVQ